MSTKLRDNALELIGKAIKKDHKKATVKEKTEALGLYVQGLEALKKAIKFEKLPGIISQLNAYYATQEERCTQLLEEIRNPTSATATTSSNSSVGQNSNTKKESDDKKNRNEGSDKKKEEGGDDKDKEEGFVA